MNIVIDKSKTALVVIDLQKGITSVTSQPHDSKIVIANAAKLAESFRKNNMPVFLVRVAPSADGKDRLNPLIDGENPWANRQLTADWSEIVPELNPQSGDHIITKKQWGAFYGTDLELQLQRRKIDTIVLCGISTNFGVESTARFAYEFGYQQIFIEDATSARSAAEHEHVFKSIFPRMGRIRTTQDIINELQ